MELVAVALQEAMEVEVAVDLRMNYPSAVCAGQREEIIPLRVIALEIEQADSGRLVRYRLERGVVELLPNRNGIGGDGPKHVPVGFPRPPSAFCRVACLLRLSI